MRAATDLINVLTGFSLHRCRYALILSLPALVMVILPGCSQSAVHRDPEVQRIIATSPQLRDVTFSEQYVCQIHSPYHVKRDALQMKGDAFQSVDLKACMIKKGQQIKRNDLLFTMKPKMYEAMSEAELAEAMLALLEYNYYQKLWDDKVVPGGDTESLKKIWNELGFTFVRAPFDGNVDPLADQEGNLLQRKDTLVTLENRDELCVYFDVPEKRYQEYTATNQQRPENLKVELILANGSKFDRPGKIADIQSDLDQQTGKFLLQANFSNHDQLLRHSQTGTIVISHLHNSALVIPQRAAFEVLQKQYVFVIDDKGVAHQREIAVNHKLDGLYVLDSGLKVNDKIVLEGIHDIRDGQKLQYELRSPQQIDAEATHHKE